MKGVLATVFVLVLWSGISARPKHELEKSREGRLYNEERSGIRLILAKALEQISDEELLNTLEASIFLKIRLCLGKSPLSTPPPTDRPANTTEKAVTVAAAGAVAAAVTVAAAGASTPIPPVIPPEESSTVNPTKESRSNDAIENVVDRDEPIASLEDDIAAGNLDHSSPRDSLEKSLDSLGIHAVDKLQDAQSDEALNSTQRTQAALSTTSAPTTPTAPVTSTVPATPAVPDTSSAPVTSTLPVATAVPTAAVTGGPHRLEVIVDWDNLARDESNQETSTFTSPPPAVLTTEQLEANKLTNDERELQELANDEKESMNDEELHNDEDDTPHDENELISRDVEPTYDEDQVDSDAGEFESIMTVGAQATEDQELATAAEEEVNNWVGNELFKKPQVTDKVAAADQDSN